MPRSSSSRHEGLKEWIWTRQVPLLHLLLIVPALGWLAFGPDKRIYGWRRFELPIAFVYVIHLWYKLVCTDKKNSLWLWIHVTIFVPLVIARLLFPKGGIRAKLLRALFFAAIGYHLYWVA